MDYQVVILSEDVQFARMLELEFAWCRLSVLAAAALCEQDRTDVLVLDLDSATAPPSDRYRKMIGFSRRPAISSEAARSCSMILRRPFRMSLLRREVLEQTGEGTAWREAPVTPLRQTARELHLNREESILICDGERIAVSPTECEVLACLLERRGNAVSRETLSEKIGKTETNKTDVYICYLRRKTDGLPNGRLIKTVRGKGYLIE